MNVRWILELAESFVLRCKNALKDKKKLRTALLLCALGVLLIAFSAATATGDRGGDEVTLEEYKKDLESELSELCSSVRGVGKCRVMVTFERGEENTYKGSSLVESKPPRVMGVSIVCRGADSDEVRRELVDMLSALFDIGSNRISVLKLNS